MFRVYVQHGRTYRSKSCVFFWSTARLANIAQSESTQYGMGDCHAMLSDVPVMELRTGPSVPWCSHLVKVETTFG